MRLLKYPRSIPKYCVFILLSFIVCLAVLSAYNNNSIHNRIAKAYLEAGFQSTSGTNFQPSAFRFDNRRMIKIYEWVWKGAAWRELMTTYNVCLATQSSIDRIWSIEEVAEKWNGPISLAVYFNTAAEWSILKSFVYYMQKCSLSFHNTVSIQMAVPANFSTIDLEESTIFKGNYACHKPMEFMQELVRTFLPNGRNVRAVYPQNHLRNIARKTCGTEWVFLTDVDIIPRPNSTQMLQQFYDSPEAANCSKCAFVIPTYELDRSVDYPESKRQLIQYAQKKLARQFHVSIFFQGHGPTNYFRWSKAKLDDGPVIISHEINSKMEFYEPFYIGPDTIPAHDERFIGYGFVRSSQVAEANLTGWRFMVLTPIFAIHWGLQSSKTLYAPTLRSGRNLRDEQKGRNYKLYRDFIKEIKMRHEIVKKS